MTDNKESVSNHKAEITIILCAALEEARLQIIHLHEMIVDGRDFTPVTTNSTLQQIDAALNKAKGL